AEPSLHGDRLLIVGDGLLDLTAMEVSAAQIIEGLGLMGPIAQCAGDLERTPYLLQRQLDPCAALMNDGAVEQGEHLRSAIATLDSVRADGVEDGLGLCISPTPPQGLAVQHQQLRFERTRCAIEGEPMDRVEVRVAQSAEPLQADALGTGGVAGPDHESRPRQQMLWAIWRGGRVLQTGDRLRDLFGALQQLAVQPVEPG